MNEYSPFKGKEFMCMVLLFIILIIICLVMTSDNIILEL